MSQEQPQRPQSQEEPQEPIKYGDVFNISGELAKKPITPQDAADMQAAENLVLGETQKGGPAAVMQSSAAVNNNRDLVGLYDFSDPGIAISDTEYAGHRIVTESVGGEATFINLISNQVAEPGNLDITEFKYPLYLSFKRRFYAKLLQKHPLPIETQRTYRIPPWLYICLNYIRLMRFTLCRRFVYQSCKFSQVLGQYVRTNLASSLAPANLGDDAITVGEALEASALSAGGKPVDEGDAAAIQAAEVRATGRMQAVPGGVAAKAQAAAAQNVRTMREEDKAKLKDVVAASS